VLQEQQENRGLSHGKLNRNAASSNYWTRNDTFLQQHERICKSRKGTSKQSNKVDFRIYPKWKDLENCISIATINSPVNYSSTSIITPNSDIDYFSRKITPNTNTVTMTKHINQNPNSYIFQLFYQQM
jgi:hypothetical protein